MNKTLIFIITNCLIFGILFNQGRKIEEEIKVEWKIVPLIVLGKDQEKVKNITENDIKIYLNNKEIFDFVIYKRATENIKKRKFINTKKYIFLVFDNILSEFVTIKKSKKLAIDLIENESENTYFILMDITPFVGLKYIDGPTRDKELLIKKIKKMITAKRFKRTSWETGEVDSSSVTTQSSPQIIFENPNSGQPLDSSQSLRLRGRKKANEMLRKISLKNFIHSLNTLDMALKTFKRINKVLYLFSDGLEKIALFINTHGVNYAGAIRRPDAILFRLMTDIGKAFSRNETLIIVMNPSSTKYLLNDNKSGDLFLSYFSRESGGSYLKGTQENIIGRIDSLNKGFYEIAFPVKNLIQNKSYKLNVISKVKGVKFNSIKKIVRDRDFDELKPLEKELFVIDVIEKGYWAKSKFKISEKNLNMVKKVKRDRLYKIGIGYSNPGDIVELYKVQYNSKEKDVKISTIKDYSKTDLIKFRNIKGYKRYVDLINKTSGNVIVYH